MEGQVQTGHLETTTEVTAEVRGIAMSVKPTVEEQLGRKLEVYEAKLYRSQVVTGTNYFIKVLIGSGDEHIHIRVFVSLPCDGSTPTLAGMQRDKKFSDPIDYF